MNDNPYSAPDAPLDMAEVAPVVPAEVLKKIKNAWIAGLISSLLTLVITLVAIAGTSIMGFSGWELIDVALALALTFGIYKNSRACAVAMLLYFVASKILMMLEAGKPTGIFVALIFTYYFWQGVVGTFAYQKLRRAQISARL